MSTSFSTHHDLFDEDSVEEYDSSESEEISSDSDDSNTPKPFLASFSARTKNSASAVNVEGSRKENSAEVEDKNEQEEVTSENVLQELHMRASHRRILSITPNNSSCSQSSSSLRDQEQNAGKSVDKLNEGKRDGVVESAEAGEDAESASGAESTSQKVGKSESFEKEVGIDMARSYVNVHESRRVFENHLNNQRKKQQSDEARMQALMLLNVFLNRRDLNKSRFPRNVFITSKYTPWNFIFINLFEQFSRVANFVFLLVTLVQLIPGVSPFNIWSTLLPLIFILLVTAVKEAWEDYLRHKADKITNNIQYQLVLRDGSVKQVPSCELVSGDVIIIKDQESIPADVLVLACSDSDGTCYVDTSSLDGETK